MRLIFLGPPGVGKGTMATRTKDLLGIPHISTGELFRENVSKGTPLGIEVKAIMDRGDLVPDAMTVAMVKDRLEKPDASGGFILDGFPRTIPQAESLSEITGLDFVLNLQCPSEELIKRLTGRRFCPTCNRTYHIHYMPPKNEGRCDEDGTDLLTRDDDSFEAVKNRLEVYTKSTEPLIHWYEKHGLLENINASVAPDNVFESIRQVLNR